jgi:hypothetical protein
MPDRVEVTYEIGFATPSGGWVKMASVPEAVVQAAEDNAKAAQQPDQGPTDLSQPAAEGEPEQFTEDAAGNRVPVEGDPAADAPAPAESQPDPAAAPAAGEAG